MLREKVDKFFAAAEEKAVIVEEREKRKDY